MPNQIKAELALLHKTRWGENKILMANDAISRSGSEVSHKKI